MDKITVDKAQLIKTLQKNRKKHRKTFIKGLEVYRQLMITEFERALDEAKNGGKIVRGFSLPVPEDHTEDFDTVIAMMDWDTNDTVQLTQGEFAQYVENNWGWQRSFASNTEFYAAQAL